jgi:CheY-like chemotaxis protein
MAISNLIDNAIKYTEKGFVNVILYKGENDDIMLDIKDTGIGIDQEFLEKMFEPYHQEQMGYGRAYEGIGLGLSLVKKVLGLNNSKLFVESKKGEGTTFSINFGKAVQSLDKMAETVMGVNVPPAPEELRKEVVLLVEDDLMNQVTIRRFIENKYNVIITDSSDEARDIVKKENIDIILMDISIKGSKNGLELTKELKSSKEFSHIPIIAVTAHAFEKDKQNSLEAGCDSYLAKPFTKKTLLDRIADYTHK